MESNSEVFQGGALCEQTAKAFYAIVGLLMLCYSVMMLFFLKDEFKSLAVLSVVT